MHVRREPELLSEWQVDLVLKGAVADLRLETRRRGWRAKLLGDDERALGGAAGVGA
jgi:hypothetical protein